MHFTEARWEMERNTSKSLEFYLMLKSHNLVTDETV